MTGDNIKVCVCSPRPNDLSRRWLAEAAESNIINYHHRNCFVISNGRGPASGLAEAAGGVEHVEGRDDRVRRVVARPEVGSVVVRVHEVLRDGRHPLRARGAVMNMSVGGGGMKSV